MSNKLRWGKFYWSDWSDDPALALCSLAAQGLWMRLMCIAAQGTPYGHVTINGKIPDIKTLARIVRARPDYCARLIAELERNGVASRSVQGALTSRRQVRDAYISMARSSAAKTRWLKEKGSDLHMQKDPFASCNTESLDTQDTQEAHETDARAPPRADPPNRPDRNAAFDLLREMHEHETPNEAARQYNARMADIARSPDHGKRKPH